MIINPYIYGVASTYDPDAQLFFNAQTAAGVTLTLTQKSAVNQWVVDSKAAGIWTKFKAIYPMVGSTATSQKFNLKNPLDTNAAYRLSFVGGGTHSSNGYQPNGINAYANTFINSLSNLTGTSTHLSYYSRTATPINTVVEIGCGQVVPPYAALELAVARVFDSGEEGGVGRAAFTTTTNAQGFWLGTKRSNTDRENYLNGVSQTTKTVSDTLAFPNLTLFLGAINRGTPNLYSAKQCAFATIGDGLTDLESQLFYQITEKYQVALSRNINTTQSFYYNSAYNNETNAFLFSTQITDNTIQTATNTLVSDLKTANIFTKMKAIYPMVGGTATTCKFNLVNAQDTNAAYRLVFSGGGTFSANGYLPNGTNAFADTFFNTSTQSTLNNTHASYYSRTNNENLGIDLSNSNGSGGQLLLALRYTAVGCISDQYNSTTGRIIIANANSQGFYITSRTTSAIHKLFKNSAQIGATNTGASGSLQNLNLFLGASNSQGIAVSFSNRQCAFASIGDGLTDAEALAFYNAVQTFNTTLNRQV
jgi:hypothetical protein